MSEEFWLTCPLCEARFTITSENTGGLCESYCPFCGWHLDEEYDDGND